MAGLLLAILLYSCASIGRPEGGPRDQDPPIFIGSNPKPNSLNVKKNKIELQFDEIVTLKDQQTKVVISPVQKENPVIRALGRKVTVEFRDTLKPNTTYSIDFADAIQDNNEGNPLEDFAIAFSTGESIDSLAVSGIVLRARDLEPMQKIIVGIHSDLNDSAFKTLQFARIARTNSLGQFTIRNLKPGKYRIYALNDLDRNYKYSRNEDAAFISDIIIPSTRQISTRDTLFTQKNIVDTVVDGKHTLFLPNDILLNMFNEGYNAQYLKAYERPEANKLLIKFAAKSDTLPEVNVLRPEPHRADWFRMERSECNDSLVYWLTDSSMIKSDSIVVSMKYMRTDSTDNLTLATDTLAFVLKNNYKKLKEQEAKQKAKEEKERIEELKREQKKLEKQRKKEAERKRKEAEEILKHNKNAVIDSTKLDIKPDDTPQPSATAKLDTLPETPKLAFSIKTSGDIEVYSPLTFISEEPIDSLRQGGFHLYNFNAKDSVWNELKIDTIKLEKPCNPLIFTSAYAWEPGGSYRITVDSCSVKGIYGLWNATQEQKFTVKNLEEYSNLYFNVTPVADSAFVELLDGSDKVIRTVPVVKGSAEFQNITPGEYYARIVLDRNGNGEWDSGNFDKKQQPEEVYYFAKPLKLKKNWDVEQTWNIYELPVDKQKPEKIKKNKPEKKKTWSDENDPSKPNGDNEDEEDFMPQIYTGNKYDDYNRNNRR